MGKRNKVTTRDIAEFTGLSQSTVSMILSGKKNVSFLPETEKKVKDAAKELGYKKPMKRTMPSDTNLSETILVLAPLLTNSYYTSIIHSITDRAASYKYTVLTAVTFRDQEKEKEALSLAETGHPAGVIILYPIKVMAQANRLSGKVPVVLIGEKPDNTRFDSVELDSKKPGFLVADHLLSLGHTRIAFISSPINRHEISRSRRLEGLRLAYESRGLDPDLIELYTPSSAAYKKYSHQSAEQQTGYEMTLQALNASTPATAFVGQNDMTAFGIMAALAEKGFRIPKDYSVAGFDNAAISALPQLSLTSVDHSILEKGRDAVDLIYNRNHNTEPHGRITRMEYEPRLIVRNSTGRLRSR